MVACRVMGDTQATGMCLIDATVIECFYNFSFDIGAGLVECCEPTVDPLIFLGILAGVAGLTVFFQQLGRHYLKVIS